MNQNRHQHRAPIRRSRLRPWRAVFDGGAGDTQPQGLIDFPPGTNVSVSTDLSFWSLLAIQASNMLFSLLTLGVYRFWAITRLRRNIWHSIELAGNRLLYQGSGLELMVSTIIAVLAFLPPLTLLGLSLAVLPVGGVGFWLCLVLSLVLYAFLRHMGGYMRLRYWASNTTWRGIKGGLGGSAPLFALFAMGQLVLVILTLGLWYPRMQMFLSGYVVRQARLGGFTPAWVENRTGLTGAWVLVWGLGFVVVVAWVGFIALAFGPIGSGLASAGFLVIALAGSLMMPVVWMGYQVAIVRARCASFALDELFVFNGVNFSQVLWLNTRIFVIYFGIAVALGIAAMLSFSAWNPWVAGLAEQALASLAQRWPGGATMLDIGVVQWGGLMLVWLWATRLVGRQIAPLLRLTAWLHIHRRSLVFEGHLDFTRWSNVEPGRFRALDDGVAMAMDAGGI